MQEPPFSPGPYQQPQPQAMPPQPAPAPGRGKKFWLLIIAGGVLLLAAAIAGWLQTRDNGPNGPAPGKPAVVMYYRDGKTVLWESKAAGWIDDVPAGPASLVAAELAQKYGSSTFKQSGWKVTTTFDADLQSAATEQLAANQSQRAQQGADQAVLAAQDVTTGQIVSWTGETDKPKVQVGTLALPFTYAALMEHTPSFAPEAEISDTQKPLAGYACTNRSLPTQGGNCLHNFDYTYRGPITVTEALATLRLVPAVDSSLPLLGKNGESTKLQNYLSKLASGGQLQEYTTKLAGERAFACYVDESLEASAASTCYTAAAFGAGLYATPLDILAAYSTLANDGKKLPATSILSIKQDSNAVYDWRAKSQQAMLENVSGAITGILTDAQASYLTDKNVFNVNGQPAGVMMGAESTASTASTVHFTSKYAVGVWVTATDGLSGPSEPLLVAPANAWLQAAHQ